MGKKPLGRDDWFRRTTWEAADREDFFARLGRARGQHSKSQYLRIQASCLAVAHPREALELLAMVRDEYPETSQLASAYLQMAQCHLALGEKDEAVTWFRRTVEQEKVFPNWRTSGYLLFASFVVSEPRPDLFGEVKALLEERAEWALFPSDTHQLYAAMAVIAAEAGDASAAAEYAGAALEAAAAPHSGFARHPSLGLVAEVEPALRRRLEAIRDSSL